MCTRQLLRTVIPFLMLLFWSPALHAQTVVSNACEYELALSAAPDHLRDDAGVLVLEENGYRLDRTSTNGFTCMVNRDDPWSIKPTCFDAEGTRTIIPKLTFVTERLLAGDSMETISDNVATRYGNGSFRSPARAGVAYMLSNYNRPADPSTGALGWFPPHIMTYAPNVTNADIGATNASFADWRLPFIGYAGPHGYIIVRVSAASLPQPGDLPSCPAFIRH